MIFRSSTLTFFIYIWLSREGRHVCKSLLHVNCMTNRNMNEDVSVVKQYSFQTKLGWVFKWPTFSWIMLQIQTFHQTINVSFSYQKKKSDPIDVICNWRPGIHDKEDSIAVTLTLEVPPSPVTSQGLEWDHSTPINSICAVDNLFLQNQGHGIRLVGFLLFRTSFIFCFQLIVFG